MKRLRTIDRPASLDHFPEFMSTEEAALLIGTHSVTLATWRRRGKGPPFLRPERTNLVRYRKSDVVAWMTGAGVSPEAV